MSEISRVSLFGKLNPLLYKAVESATVFCKLRGNPYVELVHWLQQVVQLQDSDLHRIIRHYELSESKLAADLQRSLDGLPRGATVISDLSAHIENAIERAWVYGTLLYGDAQVRSGYVLVGILKTIGLRAVLVGISGEFSKLSADELADELPKVLKGSPEDGLGASDQSNLGGEPGEASGAMAPAQMGKQEALKKYTVDLTAKARAGELDPISGRDLEIRQIVDILMRRRQNNPLLTGEAGVGKTAVVEGFAIRLARGDVPPSLKDVSLLTLDIGLLQAGASMKGEFEQRLRQIIDEVQASPKPIILFVDEVHTLVGAGGAAGTGDAANLLKPALARGTLRTIGATTWGEYKKYIEKDPALTRRFQVVQVAEPDEAKAIIMLRGVASVLEKHHRVQLLDEAITAAVRLSHRYIPARQLPDKAVSLLDTACARVAVSQHATPAHVEDCIRRIEALTTEMQIIDRELTVGIDVGSRQADASARLVVEQAQLVMLEVRWTEEKEVVARILELRSLLRSLGDGQVDSGADIQANPVAGEPAETPASSPADQEAQRRLYLDELQTLQPKLAAIQLDQPLVLPSVDEQAVGAVVADWTGIPVGRMVKNEVAAVLALTETLSQRVIGQRGGLEMISKRVQTSRAKLDNPNKPIGVFLLCGPSGVGKTETALALAESLYGGEQNVITINMSEFQEAHTVSTLKGAPPGYVGYGEGGVLTEAVRRRPYSVVLLDEIEKAHPDVHEIFFQVFDKGWMEDGEGRYIDFKNTVVILTSNVGTDAITTLCKDPDLIPDQDAIATALREPLLKVFPAALLGRVVTVPYYPLSDAMLSNIVTLQLSRVQTRIAQNHNAAFTYDDAAIKLIISRCTEVESGGRMIDAVLTNTVLPKISAEYLQRVVDGRALASISLSAENNQFQFKFG
jgi:type VI secretion system protein VasG